MVHLILSASVLILVIIALRYILRRKINLRIRYALWLLVALRLLIPVQFGTSPLSLLNLRTEATPLSPVLMEQGTQNDPTIPSVPMANTPPLEATYPPIDSFPNESISPTISTPSVQGSNSTPIAEQPEPETEGFALSWKQILNGIWAAGVGLTFLWFLVVNLRFHRKAKRNARPIAVDESPFPVYISDGITSPCLIGLLRPRVYLPAEVDAKAMRHILVHEQTHHRHLDPLWSWVRGLCLCLYWFHPLVWWAAILSRQDCELACDEGALKVLGEQERIPYGDTLLSMISHANHPRELFRTATTMANTKKQLKERVEMIAKQPKKLWFPLLFLLLAISLTVGCVFTGASREDFVNPTSFWCVSFNNLYSRAGGDTYRGDIASLQQITDLVSEKIDALETLDPESGAYALLKNTLQVADLLEEEGSDSFYDLPQWEQEALVELWYILGNANYATSEEEYLRILEANSGSWLDPWIYGSSGHSLPIRNPILPPSMPPKEPTETTPPTEEVSLERFVESCFEEGPYRIPAFTQAVTSANTFNEEIQTVFDSLIHGTPSSFTSVNYECYQKDDILSLLIRGERRDEVPLYLSYNIDTASGEPVQLWDPEQTASIRPLMLVRELIVEYMEAGSFSFGEETREILKKNLYPYWDYENGNGSCLWIDQDGRTQYSFCYYPLDGSETIRHTVCMEDYQAPTNPYTGEPKAVELLSYRGFEGFNLPDSERPLCHIPFLLMQGPRSMEINAEILQQYLTAYDSLDYSWTVNGDICTLLLQGSRDDMEYGFYNLSYSKGTTVPEEEVYTSAGYSKESFMDAAKEAILNYFFTRFGGTDSPLSKETLDHLAAASAGASNVALSRPYLDENGKLWILGRIFQIAGSSYRWYPIPLEGLPLSQGYLDFLAQPRTELSPVPGLHLSSYTIESLPNGNPLGVSAAPSHSQLGSDAVYEDLYPSGQVGPIYADSSELLREKEENLLRYLTLLLGEGDYAFQYDEAFSIRSPFYTKDAVTVFGNACGVKISMPTDTPMTTLTVEEVSENPILDAALRFAEIHAPVIQQRITYEATIDPETSNVKDYCYTIIEAPEYPSAIATLCKSISITYTPGTASLHISITSISEPKQVATTEIPTGMDIMEAVGDLAQFTDSYTRGYIECYYSSQVVLGYYVPCYKIYIYNDSLSEHYGTPTYAVYDLCNADFPTNRTEVLPWRD